MTDMLLPHYFLAVPVPLEVAEPLAQWCESLRLRYPFQRWNHLRDFHVTLCFLGGASEVQLQQITERLPEVTDRFSPFSLELTDLHTFGLEDRPRIFWAGLREQPRLFDLRQQVKSLLESIGFQLDQRAYTPHVTLAKKWKGDWPFSFPSFAGNGLAWTVKEVCLYRVHLDRVPRNELIRSFPLAKVRSGS